MRTMKRTPGCLQAFAASWLCGLMSWTAPAAAQARGGVDPSLYSGLKWRSVGPFRAGQVNGVTGVPGQPSVFHAGAVGGGVWETTNADRTWFPA